ncbi:Hypothetical predicted protein [Mytilus galloprovincialis]|uniref:Fibrinogen C-terminal domain-containing protein n=1 Tax=Mytilus galloprovincialis TaxID=29158 RepID=A0A8B6DFI3_MYTGA|nr:Hypothetical predicted protein [Mytilus galloprovincialis]
MDNQHFIAEKNIKIISSITSLEVRRTKSAISCAGFCAHLQSCCSVSFDKQSSECQLDYSCSPQCITWQNGTFLRKSSNVSLSNQETTVQTGIKTTSDNLTSSDKTTTTDMMNYKTTTDKTSYQTNNTTTFTKITNTKASTAAKTTDLTSYQTNNTPTYTKITDTKASTAAKTTDLTSYQTNNTPTYTKITDTKASTAAKTTDLTSYQTNNTPTYTKITDTKASTAAKTTDLTSYQTNNTTTYTKITDTKASTAEQTTDLTSYQTNNTTTYIKITDTKASTAAKTSDVTSYETTKLKTTTVKATPVQTTNDILDCTGVASGSTGGVYTIYIENQPVDVYCEIIGGEQWTVIQKRLDGTTDFYKNWQEYKDGFGDVNFEYWLGNENLHKILSTKSYKLRIDLEDWNGDTRYAEYDTFVVGSENTNYMLTISGYSGDAGDSLINPTRGSNYQINGMAFSTFDSDNDQHDYIHIATYLHSGWWLKWSTDANLNGKFYATEQSQSNAIYWQSWRATEIPLKSVSMKIKPN